MRMSTAFQRAGHGLAKLEQATDRPTRGGAGPTSSVPTRMATLSSVIVLVQLIGAASAKRFLLQMFTKRSRIYQRARRRKRHGLAALSSPFRPAS